MRIPRAEEKLPDNKHLVTLKSNCPEKKKCYSEYQPFTGLEPVFLVLNANEQKSTPGLQTSQTAKPEQKPVHVIPVQRGKGGAVLKDLSTF